MDFTSDTAGVRTKKSLFQKIPFPKGFHYSAITMCHQVRIVKHTWKIGIFCKLQCWELCNVLNEVK